MAKDRKDRVALQRIDDNTRRSNVADARKFIYEKNYAVDSKALDSFLKSQSLVPTSVSFITSMLL